MNRVLVEDVQYWAEVYTWRMAVFFMVAHFLVRTERELDRGIDR